MYHQMVFQKEGTDLQSSSMNSLHVLPCWVPSFSFHSLCPSEREKRYLTVGSICISQLQELSATIPPFKICDLFLSLLIKKATERNKLMKGMQMNAD